MAQAVTHDEHHYTSTGLDSWKVGFWTFIGSECLFFATLISTYMVYKGASITGPYPEEILDIPLTTISTFVLLMSSRWASPSWAFRSTNSATSSTRA
jgi:heme/copper-type cytochrome/quinol oxidase subunit 3